MLYILLYCVLFPFLYLTSLTKKRNGILIIQTAKIGDYINTTHLLNGRYKSDVLISKVNEGFAQNDTRINNYFLVEKYKKSLISKVRLAFCLCGKNYKEVIVVLPNSLNLFFAKCCLGAKKKTIRTYQIKSYEKILMLGFEKVIHTKDDWTLQTYAKLLDVSPPFIKKPFEPIYIPKNTLFEVDGKILNVALSLTAGNPSKNIPPEIWAKILMILDKFDCQIFLFGLKNDLQVWLQILEIYSFKGKVNCLFDKLEIKELPYYLSLMQLHISSDSGNAYIADCYNVPLILFEGPCCRQEQHPQGKTLYIKGRKTTSYVFKADYHANPYESFKFGVEDEENIYHFVEGLCK
ncbi:glycosyltransferase family 9 protein [Helicobacter pullorum]|uniref:glycosyltransferase family 9 protein n=1 Tax=Helicobacter pullorum TaxID=35818 RepID=UPI00242DA5CC|nr:glycosyltransferase family 9 protein [Helicobacter pullorum]